MDLSYYKTEELDNLGVNAAMDLMANHKKTPHTIKNINHLQHRIEVWEQKQATLDLMKEKMLDAEDDLDVITMVSEAETDVYRIMKFDIDSFMAKQNQIDQYEQEQVAVNQAPMDDEDDEDEEDEEVAAVKAIAMDEDDADDADDEDDLGYLQSFAAKVDHYDRKMSNIMDDIRKEYKDITFLQCLLYCHLVVFSIAATVGYLFYTPPGSHKSNYKKVQDNTFINIPVDFQSIKTPKKEMKKQLKNLVKQEKNTKESML